ncbi:MAG: hypothetical protein HY300_01115 [Verrucomicrobia bacterium]|nr:hypothetical protein [Verrucomicrobiota bacterium]
MTPNGSAFHRWLRTGDETFAAMLASIAAARESVRLEMYIFAPSTIGERFREAIVSARRRGARVQVLIDAVGSMELSAEFWKQLVDAGGEFRWFNPVNLNRFFIRNHRKALVCDESAAFIGGFNIAPEYEGDGVTRGWCDYGLELRGALAKELARSFDDSFERAEFRHQHFPRLRKTAVKQSVATPDGELLLSGPGRGRNPIFRRLREDLRHARDVRIVMAYFAPTWTLRHDLAGVARRGGRVQLLLAGKTDVPLSQLACRSFYQQLLRAGAEIYEYEPQVLHAKLIVIDGHAYAGSANLDARSLNINYELLVRLSERTAVAGAREIFEASCSHARRIDAGAWRRTHTLWSRLKGRFARFLLTRVDLRVARMQMRNLR